jgi:hypothetical protein
MYTPRTETIRSEQAYIRQEDDNITAEPYLKLLQEQKEDKEKKYQEQEDYYDFQKKEADDLNKTLEGLRGQDYIAQQEKILEARNKMAAFFKDKAKNRKDFESNIDLQNELWKIKQEVAAMRNSTDTFHGSIAKTVAAIKEDPMIRSDRANAYIEKITKEPMFDKDGNPVRDPDPYKTIMEDPQFYDPYEKIERTFDLEQKQWSTQGHADGKFSYTTTYNPRLYKWNPQTKKVEFEPSEELLDEMLQDERFRRVLFNQIHPDLPRNTDLSEKNIAVQKEIREEAKRMIKGFQRLNEPQTKIDEELTVPRTYAGRGATKAEEDKKRFQENVANLQKNLAKGDPNALQQFVGNYWKEIKIEDAGNGKKRVVAKVEVDGPGPGGFGKTKKIVEKEIFKALDPSDEGSVGNLLMTLISASKDAKLKEGIRVFESDYTPEEPQPKKSEPHVESTSLFPFLENMKPAPAAKGKGKFDPK